MSIHKEIRLEDEIRADLTAAGWLYDAADAGKIGLRGIIAKHATGVV